MKTVHKDRNLDLVGWYTVLSRDGPTKQVMQVHEQILPLCSESTAAVLLAFHPEDLAEPPVGGKLPLTLYETHYEQDEANTAGAAAETEDKVMADAPPSASSAAAAGKGKAVAGARIAVKLRQIAYTVETEEAEMISIDFVARGAANATATAAAAVGAVGAVGAADAPADGPSATTAAAGRDRAVAIGANNRKRRLVAVHGASGSATSETAPTGSAVTAAAAAGTSYLSPDEEELIATLTTRANAIRMLHARLQLLIKYVASLPADALAAAGLADPDADPDTKTDSTEGAGSDAGVSLPILRSIQALVQRLPLLVPPPTSGAFEEERQREANDVKLVSLLLDDMVQGIAAVRLVGGKFGALETAKSMRQYQSQQQLHQHQHQQRWQGGGSGVGSMMDLAGVGSSSVGAASST